MIGRLAITLPLRVIIFGHAWNSHACCKNGKSDNNHHLEPTARHDTGCDSCRVPPMLMVLVLSHVPSTRNCVKVTTPALLFFSHVCHSLHPAVPSRSASVAQQYAPKKHEVLSLLWQRHGIVSTRPTSYKTRGKRNGSTVCKSEWTEHCSIKVPVRRRPRTNLVPSPTCLDVLVLRSEADGVYRGFFHLLNR
ncbi:hypothetical protein V8C40DRAFT_79732 [Trichoderma camerunense]